MTGDENIAARNLDARGSALSHTGAGCWLLEEWLALTID